MNLEKTSWHCNFYSYFYWLHKNDITTNGCKYIRNLIIAILVTVITFPLWLPSIFVKNMNKENIIYKNSIGLFIWFCLSIIMCLCLSITALWIVYEKNDFLYIPVSIGKVFWFYIILGGFLWLFIIKFLPWLVINLSEYKLPKMRFTFIGNLWRNISDKICFTINWTDNKE